VASWAEFESARPEFAKRVRKLMSTRKHLTMATLRRDGSPRISGTEVQFAGEHLQIGSMPRALKAKDLLRDPRVAIHGPTHDPAKSGGWRGEAKIAGRAVEIPSSGDGNSFRIDIREVVITRLGTHGLAIESWTPDRGYRVVDRD
jgi:Pyridoxamine 5'-phosphate oxidase